MSTSFDRLILTQLDRVLATYKHEAILVVAWGALFALFGAALVECVGIVASGGVPAWPVHLAAVLAGLTFGYVAASTVACLAVARALTVVVCWVSIEAERAASAAMRGIVDDANSYVQGMTHAAAAPCPPAAPVVPLRARPASTQRFVAPLSPVVMRDALN